jgi:hypothetical protein
VDFASELCFPHQFLRKTKANNVDHQQQDLREQVAVVAGIPLLGDLHPS